MLIIQSQVNKLTSNKLAKLLSPFPLFSFPFPSAVKFISQYFDKEVSSESHPALTLLNKLCASVDELKPEVIIT